MTPFGAPRGSQAPTWPDDKAFLGKTADKTTGLTHVGARQYDPAIGQFISVDPLLSLDQQQSLNGYSYANNHPVTSSDPTGLESCYPNNCSGSNGTYGPYNPAKDRRPSLRRAEVMGATMRAGPALKVQHPEETGLAQEKSAWVLI